MTKTEKDIYSLTASAVEALGYELYDVLYLKESSEWYLRFFITKKDNRVDLDDCEKVSNKISEILDREDPIAESYNLEVSSCGLEPHLREPSHFEKAIGKNIQVKLYKPLNKQKEFEGELLSFSDDVIELAIANEQRPQAIDIKDISAAKILYNWEELENE